MELRDLEKNVEEILERNKRVELDKKWESILNGITDKIDKFVEILDGKDYSALKLAKLENKATILYTMMDDYPKPIAEKIMSLADYISQELAKMLEYQEKVKEL